MTFLESISIDFLGGLPIMRRGHNYLFVVVNRFLKMLVIMPCKKTITKVAWLFFQHMWTHFSLPSSIVSDYDGSFLSSFWSLLWNMMDTKLNKSTTFHPQIDGQTKVMNRIMVYLLRWYNFRHPNTWNECLPFLQFAFNRAVHSSSSKSSFKVCLGYLL